ncbi:MAG: 4'-phosphopantetheinyl transferase superfamily protein [Bacteroidaceae bacterium]|nr:4'-phosphopantetheinyl transferase superfamily protein [Bacteroidaceae bacterium]
MIYIDDHIEEMDLEQVLAEVSVQRREKALRFRHEAGRRQSVAAYRLLQRALREEYGITEPQELAFGEHGKPILKVHPEIHFSLSHCRVAVACAVSERPVGIDIESIRSYREELAAYVLSEADLQEVMQAERPDVEFIKRWTQKEAFLKLTGQGISNEMKHLDMSGTESRTEVNLQGGYVWTVTNFAVL